MYGYKKIVKLNKNQNIFRLHPNQVSNNQKLILEKLGNLFGYKNCRFLEIGSWLGDSTKILGNVVKKFDGTLICVDNWKGSPTTNLKEIAENNDIYQIFRSEMIRNHLDDHVLSLKADSRKASYILKNKNFDFIFLDSDHRYSNVKNDILNYLPKLRKGGVFCGHDCEGYLKDFSPELINCGLNQDVYKNIHCGVIKAVGETIENVYVLNQIFMRTAFKNNVYLENIFSQLKLDFYKNLIFFNKKILIEQNGKNVFVFNFKNNIIKKVINTKSFYLNIFLNNAQKENNLFLNINPVLIKEDEISNIIFFKNKYYICPKANGKIDFFDLKDLSLEKMNIKVFYKFSDISDSYMN